MRQITFSVDDRVFAALGQRAEGLGYRTGTYAKMLFEAAFAVRVGVTDEPDLHQRIELAIVLHGARKSTADIADAVGLSEASVCRIIDAWKVREAAE